MFQPVIKWSGSKRSQSDDIVKMFPKQINTYYELFCGGCSILRKLLDNKNIYNVNKYICSDLNSDLIDLWNLIKNDPLLIFNEYETLWNELNKDNDISRKKNYFYKIRDKFNQTHYTPYFIFIMRTTTNGMPRYNNEGNFNNSFHFSRNGIMSYKLKEIIFQWQSLLNENNVCFKTMDFNDIKIENINNDDFFYLDPPYFHTKGMYYGTIDYKKLWNFLEKLPCHYALSFDGKSGDIDNTTNIPTNLYSEHIYIKSGNSSFKRIVSKANNSIVYESLYIK
jgi:DNA adenine methylase